MDNTQNTSDAVTNDMIQELKWNQLLKAVEAPKLDLQQVTQPADDLTQWQFLSADMVKQVANSVDSLISQLSPMMSQGYTTEKVSQLETAGVHQVFTDWKNNYMSYAQTNLDQLNSIQKDLAAPVPYDNPENELLRRQDAVQRLKLVDNTDLVQYVLDRLNGADTSLPDVSKYEFNELSLAAKSLSTNDQAKVEPALESYKEANFEPWLQSSVWLGYGAKIRELQVLQTVYGADRVWLLDPTAVGGWFQFDEGGLTQLLARKIFG